MADDAKSNESREEIIGEFNERRQEVQALVQKITQLDGDRMEHELVTKTLKDLEPGRRCFRLINNVLCERTVQEVQPAVESNHSKICDLLESLGEKLKGKQKELADFKSKHGIVVKGEDAPQGIPAQ